MYSSQLALSVLIVATGCGPSLESLHGLAMAGQVQRDAPIHAHQSITIAAPRERVYALLTDFGRWPHWRPKVAKMVPPPKVQPGASFAWVSGDVEISSTLAAVKPNELVAWSGSASMAKAVHVWRFSSPSSVTTQVEVEETMDGPLLTWFYGQAELEADMAHFLTDLKRAAEAAED